MRKGGPAWSFIVLTRQCNQYCSHCYVWDNKVPHMSTETHKAVIDKLCDLGVPIVSYFGGEPTLHPNIVDFIRYAKSSGRGVYLSSDITACPPERLTEIMSAGVDVLSFSLDKVLHAKWNKRTVGAVGERLDILEELRRGKVDFGLQCNVTIHKGNLYESREVVESLLARGQIGVTIRPALFPIPYPQVATRAESLLLTEEDIPAVEELTKWVMSMKRQGHAIVTPYSYLEGFSKFLAGGHRWDCGAQRDIVFVEWDGSLLPCSYFIKGTPPHPFDPFKMDFTDLEEDHWDRTRSYVEQMLGHSCNTRCYTSAYYCTAYYRRNPWDTLRNFLKT